MSSAEMALALSLHSLHFTSLPAKKKTKQVNKQQMNNKKKKERKKKSPSCKSTAKKLSCFWRGQYEPDT